MKRVPMAGSGGLIGSEVVRFFDGLRLQICGVDSKMCRESGGALFAVQRLDFIVYCPARPSRDSAARMPHD